MYRRFGCVFLLAATALVFGTTGCRLAFAEAKKDTGVTNKQTAAPMAAPKPPTTASAHVEGFRSAKFGMSDSDVKNAIVKDFDLKREEIQEKPNPGERTTVLSVKVPDLLPGGGAAEVSYVLGYESKKLIQVSISWSKATDEKMSPEQLFSNSSVLRAHFLTEGFRPDTIASNAPINGGLLVFRGSDVDDHTVMLILQGTMAKAKPSNTF